MTSSARLGELQQFLDDEVVLIVVAQIVGGHRLEVVDDPPRKLHVSGDLVAVVAQQRRQRILAIHLDRPDPGEVIQSRMTELHNVRRDAQPRCEQALETDCHIAEPDRTVAMIQQRAGHDANRVGEIDDPGVVRREPPDAIGDVEHDRHGAQRFGESAGAGGLLADASAAQGDRLIAVAGCLAADANLQEHS